MAVRLYTKGGVVRCAVRRAGLAGAHVGSAGRWCRYCWPAALYPGPPSWGLIAEVDGSATGVPYTVVSRSGD